jgi:hypothetical protein
MNHEIALGNIRHLNLPNIFQEIGFKWEKKCKCVQEGELSSIKITTFYF